MTRTVNQPSLCVITRTVNLPNMYVCGQWNQQCHNLATRWVAPRNLKWNQKWHNQPICDQCQRLLGNRLGHSLKYLGTLSIQYYPSRIIKLCVKILQASTVTHLEVQICVQTQETWRYNQTICSQWKLNSRSHNSTQGHKYRQANVKETLRCKLDF